MNRAHRPVLLAGVLVFTSVLPTAAQGLPAWRPISPAIASRSPLGFQPVIPARTGWRFGMALDYGSAVEVSDRPGAGFLLDAELFRLDLAIGRDLGPRWFAGILVPVVASHAGFLDGPIGWWHGVFGFSEQQRESRPRNEFAYRVTLPDGTILDRPEGGPALGDLRLQAGFRHARGWQTLMLVALPTSMAGDGYGLSTAAVGVMTSLRSSTAAGRLSFEGSAGLGYAPGSGDLADFQREWLVSASSGLRIRVLGEQSVYGNLLFHSAGYRGTSLPALDHHDLSLDFGFLLRTGGGAEIIAGMVEDLHAFGPAVDLVFRLGMTW